MYIFLQFVNGCTQFVSLNLLLLFERQPQNSFDLVKNQSIHFLIAYVQLVRVENHGLFEVRSMIVLVSSLWIVKGRFFFIFFIFKILTQ